MTVLLKVTDLSKEYKEKHHWFNQKTVTALEPISFEVRAKKTLAIVGETGSGKSTLAKLLVGAREPTTGSIKFNDQPITDSSFKQRCQYIRMIFQDSGTTLNPSLTIRQLLDEPLKLNTNLTAEQRTEYIKETLQQVGLLSEHMNFYPHMFSGGQKHRISLARAIILKPKVIILDEALAALDPSLRSQIINLLLDLQQQMALAFILISHNLGIIRHFSDEMIVLKKGCVVEKGKTNQVLKNPQHNYTKKLIMNQHFLLSKK